jgi:zinc protease
MESDRFAQSLYDPAQVESERTVIISEREGYENEPTFRLTEEVQAASFRVHSYHHEIIGDMIDLKTMSRVDLYAHYRRYYVPGNAILSIAGDIRPQATLRKIRKTFGAVPRTAVPPHVVRPEPAQRGERRIILEGPGGTSFLQVSYRTPAADHADYFPLTVLDSVLAGASNPSAFGSGISNKTSRLYQALVEGELASSLRGSLPATMDPFQYTIYATMRADRPAEDGLQRLDEELERVRKGGLSQAEISKAIKQARALFAYNSESVTTQAYWLAFSEMVADRTWFDSYLERLSAVTVAEVTDVARRYLIPANRVVGIYHPTGNASDE